ncbi:hypothetical protein L9F63_001852 [Diploptera punctata]|uniref:Uncharacterized protein n=1 Tax=Diploptera punctata TaxID=6984 RepID=A0AAD8A557_DIPPU|nr:hypothetical protein L9F63_001852 [Diploptera punctata]
MKDLKYIDNIQTFVITNNSLKCDQEFRNVVNLLIKDGVASSDSNERKQSEEMRVSKVDNVEITEDNANLGWNTVIKSMCQGSEKLVVDPSYDDYVPITDEEGEATEINYSGNPNIDVWGLDAWDFPEMISNNPEEEIQKHYVYQSKTNYMWPIIIVTLAAFIVFSGFAVLGVYILRWQRQKNSYRNRIVKRHSLPTPRIRRGASTVYQQLYEETTTPTTPVMMTKQTNEQRTYSFPENKSHDVVNATSQINTKVSYQSSPFHHSNIVPESV